MLIQLLPSSTVAAGVRGNAGSGGGTGIRNAPVHRDSESYRAWLYAAGSVRKARGSGAELRRNFRWYTRTIAILIHETGAARQRQVGSGIVGRVVQNRMRRLERQSR